MAKSHSKRKKTGTKKILATAIKAASPDSSLTVLYIHGIGNKPAPSVLKRQWDQALFKVDMGERTRMAYWADIRNPQPLPSGQIEGLAMPMPEAYHFESEPALRPGSKRLVPYGPEAQAYAEAVARKMLAPPPLPSGPQAKGMEAKILPGFIRKPVTEWLTRTFIQDTAAYFFDADQREAMRDRLRRLLIPESRPYVIVAHSQGSIIAYDVLRELADPLHIPLLVTIGSPLGIDEVQDHLEKPLRVPASVDSWKNFADLLDPVATDKTLSDEFTPRGTIGDETVINRDTISLTNFNPHSGTGYLSVPVVRTAVNEVVGPGFREPITPFVIARDVAADMADPSDRVRLPVLIELDESIAGADLASKRERLEHELKELVHQAPEAKIDGLRRYVAADLTPAEVDRLSARHKDLTIARIWKNSHKHALLNVSTHVVQAYTAHLGYRATGKDITWAVLDTGIAAGHPHFSKYNNIAKQFDCTQLGPPVGGQVADRDGHGTHVAGIIAGEGVDQDGKPIQAMAPEAKLYIYKVLGDDGTGNDSWIIKALDHIANVNEAAPAPVIHGVNLSLGGPFDATVFGCGHSPICRELRRLWRQGVVVCLAAGNEGQATIQTSQGEQELNLDLSIGDPANLEEAIAVGSVHKANPHFYGISYFSSRGPTADGRAKPDLVAPGEQILSCNARFTAKKVATHYVAMSGTSMACPHVSGIVAAFLSVRREFIGHPDQVKEILLARCTDLKRDRYHQGAGMPNLVRMLMET
ncbi:MAG TPA: S8 family peptidase [Nitrospiraceae bacterium]|nr:S8 family peptidase [Nitrospiraceae bacterium]